MKKLSFNLSKWFDLNLGWFFTHPLKQKRWCNYLKEKYPVSYNKYLKKKWSEISLKEDE